MTYQIEYRIEQDTDCPINPRKEWDNVGTMVCWHDRYDLGDEQPKEDPQEYMERMVRSVQEDWFNRMDWIIDNCDYRSPREAKMIEARDQRVHEILDRDFIILPLYLYDHSGITMRCSPFSCPWDSGQVGFIYCSMDKAREEWGGGNPAATDEEVRAAAIKCLTGEVKTYDSYLTGDVWGYVVERVEYDEDGDEVSREHLDSCWGFVGEEEYCEQEAKDSVEYYEKEMLAEPEEACAFSEN
jgi:hypothetical protein